MYLIDIGKGEGDKKIKNLIVIIDFYFRINYSVNLVDGKMVRGRK